MYPRNADELVHYLQNSPELHVVLPGGATCYTFQRRHGQALEFLTRDDRLVTLRLDAGQIDYELVGFTRRVGKFTAQFHYTGSKPWQVACAEEKAA